VTEHPLWRLTALVRVGDQDAASDVLADTLTKAMLAEGIEPVGIEVTAGQLQSGIEAPDGWTFLLASALAHEIPTGADEVFDVDVPLDDDRQGG
jgi:hypothetical protein